MFVQNERTQNSEDALEDVDWSKAMEEEIEKIEKIRHGL